MLEVRGLAKSFGSEDGASRAGQSEDSASRQREFLFESIDLEVARGEWVAIVGESGSGKSTLLNLIAGLDRPDRGEVRLDGHRLDYSHDDGLAMWRRRHVGFVFQAFHLLAYLSVQENVALPLALLAIPAAERYQRAREAIAAVGLGNLWERRPGSLSGGEAQRVAIARALVHRPSLVLADEPTGNLDAANAAGVLACLGDAVKRAGAAALMVTHSPVAAAAADRVLVLSGGKLR
jgi:putative ABC transport system ATP-binding protein